MHLTLSKQTGMSMLPVWKRLVLYWHFLSDGRISASELGRVLSAAGVDISETQLNWIISKIDKDGSGSVDKEELRTLIKIARMLFSKVFSFMNEHDEEQVRSVLIDHDTAGSGSITKEELPKVLRSLNPDIDENEVRMILNGLNEQSNTD